MNNKPTEQDKLRKAAEAKLARAYTSKRTPPSAEKLLHELQVLQIELEMQNEELRQSQIALEESRDHYLGFYDFAPDGYITLTREGIIAEINLTGAALLGLERNKLLRQRLERFISPEDRDRYNRHFLDVFKKDDKLTFEVAFNRHDGSSFHAQLDCRRLVKKDMAPTVHMVLTDITERKQAERMLLQNKTAIDRAFDGYLIVDDQGILQEANQAYARMIGYSTDELSGMHLSQLEGKESQDEVKARVAKIISQGKDVFETRHRRKDGSEIEFEVSVSYFPDSKQFVAFYRNITERKQAEDNLRTLSVVFESNDPILITDAHANILRANQKFLKITGYSLEEIIGKNPRILQAERYSKEYYKKMWDQLLRKGSWEGEIRIKDKQGYEIPIEMLITAVKNDHQETTHYVAIYNF